MFGFDVGGKGGDAGSVGGEWLVGAGGRRAIIPTDMHETKQHGLHIYAQLSVTHYQRYTSQSKHTRQAAHQMHSPKHTAHPIHSPATRNSAITQRQPLSALQTPTSTALTP